ncbi:hypothetical protein ACFL2I_06225 [Candidatus Omnitrophota bacterium]
MKTSLLKRPYRLGIYLSLALISINILVKMYVWHGAFPYVISAGQDFPIKVFKDGNYVKFTFKPKQQIFDKIDYLLAPAFILPFALLTVKLIKSRDPFEEVA